MRRKLLPGLAAVLLLAASVAPVFACDGGRPPVAAAADQNAVLIADFPRPAPIAELAALAAPDRPAARPAARFAPAELTLYTISGILVAIDRVEQGDYRLVIADPDQPQTMMIAVSTDPACAAGSRFADNIRAVRHALDRAFGGVARLTPNLPVTVTGAAFFATLRGLGGAAPNGIELRPMIGIAFP